MTVILSIDPASNQATKSNTGIVLIENGKLLDNWCLPFGVKGFRKWHEKEFEKIKLFFVAKYKKR